MFEFLQGFFQQYPQFKDLPFFVTGESYAGHYVPAVANRIWKGNQNKEGLTINLAGAAIGNGFVNAKLQFPEYIDFAKDNNLLKSPSALRIVEEETKICESMLKNKLPGAMMECDMIIESVQHFGGNFNVYDIRKKCDGPLCYNFSPLDDLMKDKEFRDSLGVSPNAHWSECSKRVYADLAGDWVLKCDKFLVPLLNKSIPVLVYSGDQDFICNYYGGRAWTSDLQWDGTKGFNEQGERDYMHKSSKSGTIKSYGPLTFLVISQAGHMVPMDQPEVSLQMIDAFIHNRLPSAPVSLFTDKEFVAIA